ncbi:hypothetical protein AB0J04_25050, partial [Streptomyces sp. NPDC050263]
PPRSSVRQGAHSHTGPGGQAPHCGATEKVTGPARSTARWDGQTWHQLPAPEYGIISDLIADESGTVWATGWQVGEPHSAFSRWNGDSWIQEAPPTELTSTSYGSLVTDMSAVPGTRAVVAVGTAACESVTENCGVIASRGMR